MNFVLDFDIRSVASAPAQDAASASLAPTPGGQAFAENFQALYDRAHDPLSFSPDTGAPLLPSFILIEPRAESLAPADPLLVHSPALLPSPSLAATPDTVTADMEGSAPYTLPLPALPDAAAPPPSSGSDAAITGLTGAMQVASLQPESPLIIAAVAEPVVRQAVAGREPAPRLERAALPGRLGPDLAPPIAAAPAPTLAAPDNIPAPNNTPSPGSAVSPGNPPAPDTAPEKDALASFPAQTGHAFSIDAVPANEPARSDSQTPLPAPAAALTISAAPTQTAASMPAAAAAPVAQAVLVALPSELPDIVTRAIQDRPADRITVQLDPPELGRVSIDFRFEGQTLQHVTITGETPEAVRQLRLMHGELLEALEQNGLGQKDMTFQQERKEQAFTEAPKGPAGNRLAAPQPAILTLPTQTAQQPGRLDIRL